MISDCGSKYHKVSRIDEDKLIEAYRPSLAPYDHVYKKKYPVKKFKNVLLNENKWDNSITLNSESDLLAVDCMYYPGV